MAGLIVAATGTLAIGAGDSSRSEPASAAQEADAIAAGFDLFETDPEQTVFRFRGETAIPANFFAEGSERFEGDVSFGGVPLGRFRTLDVGDADTVVRRHAAASVPRSGSPSEPVAIEVVRLSLVSMAPIEVRVGNATQRWRIRAGLSPSRPSSGQMTIARTDERFGTFDSRLVVYPKFTFTRVRSRRARAAQTGPKVLDVGALPDAIRPDDASLTFSADGVPWRRGCVEPALVLPLNEDFCPGLAQGGHGAEPPGNVETDAHKELTPHQSEFAEHGIWPVQARLEHFACYTVRPHSPFSLPDPSVALRDQFGQRLATVVEPDHLCNPARKESEPFKNRDAHLMCYRTSVGAAPNPNGVEILNQFGQFRARVRSPSRLCLPATKQRLPGGDDPPTELFVTEHFQCYGITPFDSTFTRRRVTFTDQFHQFAVRVFRPRRLCAPVRKGRAYPVQHHVRHLVCYRVAGPRKRRRVLVRNQFTQRVDPPRPERFRTRRVVEVCIPSLKVRIP